MKSLPAHLEPRANSSGAINREKEILYQLPLYDDDIESIHQMYSLLSSDQQELFCHTYIPFKALQTYKAMAGNIDSNTKSRVNTAIGNVQSKLDQLNKWKSQACGIGKISEYKQDACTVRQIYTMGMSNCLRN